MVTVKRNVASETVVEGKIRVKVKGERGQEVVAEVLNDQSKFRSDTHDGIVFRGGGEVYVLY